MFRLWFERPLPAEYAHLLDGAAVAIGAAQGPREKALDSLPQAQAIIASARIRYNGDFMDQAPELKIIARTGIGIDNITVPDATQRGIAICNAPDAPTVSTAEHAITLMLAVGKRLKRSAQALRQGALGDIFNNHGGLEMKGLTLAVVGLGRIGRRVVRVAQALEMNVVGYDPLVAADPQASQTLGIELAASLEELLPKADIVTLHVPSSAETRRMIDAKRLAQMKRGAILINTARGELVNQDA